MRKQKAKTRTSFASKYDDERQILKDQLDARGTELENYNIVDRFKRESGEEYAQRMRDAEIMNSVLSNIQEYDNLIEDRVQKQQEEAYTKHRQETKDEVDQLFDKYVPIYKPLDSSNSSFIDKVLDVYDFFTNNRPGQPADYINIKRDLLSTAFGISGIIKNSPWARDMWNYHGRKMNDFQIGDYQGYMDRAFVFNSLLESEKKAVELEQSIAEIDANIQKVANSKQQQTDQVLPEQKDAIINQLNQQKQQLLKQLDALSEDRKALDSYTPGMLSTAYNFLERMAVPLKVISNNPVFGKTSEIRDELVDITRGLNDYDRNASFQDRLKQIQSMQNTYSDKLKEWNEGIEENLKDKESYGKVSDFFQKKADNTPIEFFNPDTYLFGMPGLIAGSTSSMNKQIPAMITGYASGQAIAGGAMSEDVAAILGGIGGTLGTYALNYASGISENNSEVAFAYTEKLKDALKNKGEYDNLIKEGRKKIENSDKLTDDEIFDQFRRGNFTTDRPEIQKEMYRQAIGIESAFQDDMAATTWDAAIDTALEVIPLGSGLKALKSPLGRPVKNAIRSNKYWRQAITSEPAKKFIRSNFGQRVFDDALTGFGRGSVIGPVASIINAPLHVALAPAEKWAGNAVRAQIAKKLGWTTKVVSSMPEATLGKAIIGSTRTKYMLDISGRLIKVSLSEGIEEGKQGIVSNRFKNGYYDSNIVKSVWDTALDDFIAGSKSAELILGMPAEQLFPEEDRKLMSDIKGGMLMGMFGHSTIVNVVSNAAPYIQEQKANQFIVDQFLNQKFDTVKRFNKAQLYAEKAKEGSAYNSVLHAFDRLTEVNQGFNDREGQYAIDPQAIKDEIAEFKNVAREANNLYTIKAAKAQGIEPGTIQYNQFVAAKSLAIHEIEDAKDAREEAKNDLESVQTDIRMQYIEEEYERLHPSENSEQEGQSEVVAQPGTNNLGFGYTNQIAKHVALLRRKQEIEVGIENAEQQGKEDVKAALKNQLAVTNKLLDISKYVIGQYVNNTTSLDNIEDTESGLVFDKESHEKLVPLWKEYLLRQDDLDLASSKLNDVIGVMQIKDGDTWRDLTNDDYADPEEEDQEGKFNPAKDIDKIRFVNGNAKEVIKQYTNMVDSDNRLEEDLQNVHREQVDNTINAVENGAIDTKGNVIDEEKLQRIEQGVPEQQDPEEEFRQEIEHKPEEPEEPVEQPQTPTEEQPEVKEEKPAPVIQQEQKKQEPTVPVQPATQEQPAENQQGSTEQEQQPQQKKDDLKIEIGSEYGRNNKVVTQEKYNKFLDSWREAHNRLNSGILPAVELGYIVTNMAAFHIEAGIRKFADFARKMLKELGEDVKPYLKSSYLGAKYMPGMEEYAKEMDSEEYVANFDLDNIPEPKTQKDVLEELKRRSQQSQEYVLEVTSEYYLIKVGDQEIKMPRVHSVMPKYWVDDEDQEHKDKNPNVQSSLQVGGAFDTLARIFFSNKQYMRRFADESTKQILIDELFNTDVELFKKKSEKKLNKTFVQLYKDRAAFVDTLQDLYNLAVEYDKLGWELVSDPIVWFKKFNKGYVAGETDMIAVDKNGNIHIIDFKTARGNKPFERLFQYREDLTKYYSDLLSSLTKDDFTQGSTNKSLSAHARQIKKQIRTEIIEKAKNNIAEDTQDKNSREKLIKEAIRSGMSIILVWNDTTNIAEIHSINSNFYSTNGSWFRRGPKSEEYSDQLTAYSEMIQSQLFNVIDLEIVGFRALYHVDYTNIKVQIVDKLTNNVNGRPFRIKLSFSEKMRGILNNEGPVDQLPEQTPIEKESAEEEQIIKSTETQQLQVSDSIQHPVDNGTLAKPDAPRINPVQAKTKEYNGALNHCGLDYIRISKDQQFTDDTNAYDFITWCIENGTVELYTEVVKGETYVYANINYKGHEYKRVYIQTHTRVGREDVLTEAGRDLIDKIVRLESKKKAGQKIVATRMNRTAGRIGVRPDGLKVSALDVGLIAEPNLSDIEFTSSDPRFGFVKNGDVVSFENGNPTQQSVIFTFKGRDIPVPNNGTFVFIKSTNHKEKTTQSYIPVVLTKKSLSDDFDFIIDCLKNIDQLDKPYVFTQNGQAIRIEATRRQLLSLLIPYVNDISETENILSIVRDKNNPSTFYITSKNRTRVAAQVNLLSQKSIDDFKQQLATISVTETPRMLTSRLGDTRPTAMPVFASIRKFFADKNNKVKSLNISSSLKFDFEDFKLTDSTKTPNKKNEGLSGLGWAIKTGWFTTDYAGMLACNVEIDDADITDDKPIDVSSPASVDEIAETTSSDSVFDMLGGAMFKRETQADTNKSKLTSEQIRKNLRPILGKMVDDPKVMQIITGIPYDPKDITAKIVGKASSDAITIYNAAFTGVEYHEAFHRIFELYVPKKIRDLIYKNVAKKIGVNLSESNESNNYAGHRTVAERIADDYMDIKLGEKHISRFNFVNKAYNIIRDITRIFKNLDNVMLYTLYLATDAGLFKYYHKVSDESKQRFDTMFKELNYEIHGHQFENILNDVMYEDVKNTAFYLLTVGQTIDLSGSNIQDVQITRDVIKKGADLLLKRFGIDIFGKEGERTAGQKAMNEIYEKFYAISDDLAAKFSQISTDYVKQFEEEEREKMDGDEESIRSANYEEQIRASYEFSRFDKASSRVKFFFSMVPNIKITPEGKVQFITNALGMPTLMPMNYVFNEVLTNLWDVDTIDELMQKLNKLAKNNSMFGYIKHKLSGVIKDRVVDGNVNYDKEALLVQLMNTIRSNRHTFMIARSERAGDQYTIVLETSDSEYNAKFYPMQWGQVLAKGGTEILKVDQFGRLVFNPKNKYASQLFSRIGDFFDSITKIGDIHEVGLKQMLSSAAFAEGSTYRMTVKVVDPEKSTGDVVVRKSIQLTDLRIPEQCNIVKDKIVEALNAVGIRINSDEFEFMLQHKYGSSDWEALKRMMDSTSTKDSIGSFLQFLKTIVYNGRLNLDEDGNVVGMRNRRNPVTLEQAYSQMAFVKDLGNWKWAYRHSHDQLTVLALDGNRFYEISDNDYISDVLRGLNKRDRQFEDLKQDPYNYYIGEEDALGERQIVGSITLNQLTQNPELKLLLRHFIGFKTDKKGDQGSDYFEISRREDYLSKATILENGGIILLTLSDKKKYCYIDGITLPGINYNILFDDNVDQKIKQEEMAKLADYKIFRPGIASINYSVQQNADIVDQMISYAMAEYESVKKAGEKIDELERIGQLQQDVVNYYTLQQGARFSSLLGIWENTYDKEGNITGERFVSFNKSTRTWRNNLAIAEQNFFNRSKEEQRALIARNLQHILDKELKTAVELGLIQKFDSQNPYLGYRNVGLNSRVISTIRNAYKAKYPTISDGDAESLAIVMYLSDISSKSIMSGQEVERLFSGNPAFYKWKYDKQGNLIDRTTDELKRLGGLGSTGTNNFLELSDIPAKYIRDGVFTGKYVQAEVDNEMVSSPQIEEIRKLVYENQLKYYAYLNREQYELQQLEEEYDRTVKEIKREYKFDADRMREQLLYAEREYESQVQETKIQIANDIYNSTIEQVETSYPQVVELSKIKASEVAEAYAQDIDVADGAAYITDEMCEMLLRMVGSYTEDIKKAFDILRGRVKANYLEQADAYNTVLTSVIGSQKYTAFGRRMQDGVSVPYYNKMALFPIFDCIATGKMRNILDKMRQQGIDVLAVNSAVKLGSQGSKPVNWSDYRIDNDPTNEDNFVNGDLGSQNWKPVFEDSFSFNTYEQDFAALRKQLNTDPTEEKLMRAGTQMQKVVFSNMIEGKTYIGQDGSQQTGLQLRNRIMSAMNALSDIGLDKLNRRFFVTDEEGYPVNRRGDRVDRNSPERLLDTKKFAEEVSKMMSERGADKNIMTALEYIRNKDENYIPLGAISNSSWIESVLISVINKEVIDVNTPGAFFIQRSVWGMEGQKMLDRSDGKILGATLYNGKELQMINNKNSMDCVLSLDFFEHILPMVPVKDEDGRLVYKVGEDGQFILNKEGNRVPQMRKMSFTEAREWLLEHNIIGENADANIVGYRIPTQAESSIHALRCVDVLPVVRDTVILPKEFTKITGSDFDIDKLGLSWLNYNKQGNTEFEQGSAEYYQNQILQSFLTLLVDKDTQHILHRSIDNDTKLLKDIIEELETKSNQMEQPYSFYSLSTQTERKNDYITGKIGIGPFALNNNNHILTMLYGVKFKKIEGSLMTELGLTDLSKKEDFEHNSILSWISALINAHVDIAKDPYISKLNVNPFTYNLVNTLIRTGFGRNTFYFTTQPIMKELAKAYMIAESSYMADPNKTQYQLQKEAIEEVAKQHFGEEELPFLKGIKFEDIQDNMLGENPFITQGVTEAFKQIVDLGILRDNANREYDKVKGATITVAEQEYELNPNQVQYIMYLGYLQMDPYAKSVSSLVKYSKIDTKKQGNNYVEQQLYLQGFVDLFYSNEAGGLFESKPLINMADKSYIGTKTKNAIAITKSILQGQFLQSTDGFDNARRIVLNKIGRPGSKDLALNNKVVQIIMAAIKSDFINMYAETLAQNNPTYIRDLVNESFEENLGYQLEKGSSEMVLSNDMKYKPSSYIGGRVIFGIVGPKNDKIKIGDKLSNGVYVYNIKTVDGNNVEYQFSSPVIGANDDNNSIIIPFVRNTGSTQGSIIMMTGGKNTIYDRFNNLVIELYDNPDYLDILDPSGNPTNMLLRSLVPGRTYDYRTPQIRPTLFTETPDTYDHLKFIKLFNALDNNGVESNYIIDAWDQLLHDTKHPALRKFAEDLVVYAFVTSGDKGGFTKFFKQVPLSWRKESGYGRYIQDMINNLTAGDIDEEMLDDAILNNWFDNDIVRTYYLQDKNKVSQFITYSGQYRAGQAGFVESYSFPLVLSALRTNDKGMLEPSIDPNNAPIYIKIPRRMDDYAKESQRKYTVFRLQGIAMTKNSEGIWIKYPVYVKVNPKGTELKGGYLMTEYGRNDSIVEEKETDVEKLEAVYKVAEFISRQDIENYRINFSEAYSNVVENLNYSYMLEILGNDSRKFEKALSKFLNSNIEETVENTSESVFDASNAEFYSGGAEGSDTAWASIAKEYGIKIKEYLVSDFDNLSEEWKQKLDTEYKSVVNILGRKVLPMDTYAGKLVRRDMMQADKADAIFAIGTIGSNGYVNGGTAYASTRGIQRGIPVYLYDREVGQWKSWNYSSDQFEITSEPTLTPHAAVIGTRGDVIGKNSKGIDIHDITDEEKQVIRSVFDKTINKSQTIDINTISDRSAAYGVEIIPGGSTALKSNYVAWQQQHPEGIVAYRVNFNKYATPEEASAGRIGNPFSENSRGENTVQQFYDWIVTGNNFGNIKATEEYRQAIIQRILNTPENAPILYYTELNRPSHATVLGYLVNNKQLLQQSSNVQYEDNPALKEALNSNEHEYC